MSLTCPECFEPIDVMNPACPNEEAHSRPRIEVEQSEFSARAISWGKVLGQTIHTACAGPELMALTWGSFNTREQANGGTCDICGKPLDELP